jgi:hypothetical protein
MIDYEYKFHETNDHASIHAQHTILSKSLSPAARINHKQTVTAEEM